MKTSYLLVAQHPEENRSRSRRFHTPDSFGLFLNMENTQRHYGEFWRDPLKEQELNFERGGATKTKSYSCSRGATPMIEITPYHFHDCYINIPLLNLNMSSL